MTRIMKRRINNIQVIYISFPKEVATRRVCTPSVVSICLSTQDFLLEKVATTHLH
jgi:hypothetical protein